VTAVLVGLASALLWGAAGLVNGRVARAESAPLAVAWALLTGFVVAGTLAIAASGVPAEATGTDWAWALTASVATLGGLLLSYESYRRGKLGVVAPIVATQGAIAAVIAVLAGDPLALGAGVMLVIIVVGVVLASKPEALPEDVPPVPRRTSLVAPAVALAGALSFGVGLFAASRVSDDLSAFWLALMPRATGLVLLVIPLLLTRGMRVPRPLWPLVAVGGTLEVSGLIAFVVAARDSAAIAAVMASQFAIVTAVGGVVLWREHLTRVQIAGIAVVAAGVAGLAVLQA
jgi:drug/metabolite transporter (DMT)-like permease